MKTLLTKLKTLAVAGMTMGLALGAQAGEPVSYLEPVYKTTGESTSGIDHWETKSIDTYNLVTADTATLSAGWWVVDGTVSRAGITVEGAAHLILKDGCSLTVQDNSDGAGIEVTGESHSLVIYGQAAGTGKLIAKGGENGAGIGGGNQGNGESITINGGTVTATGGDCAAGIGGGEGGVAEYITINGGTVKANGGKEGAGIGGGSSGYAESITINGGTVTAAGGDCGAGIGGGAGASGRSITINGGTVTATGGDCAAGIGGGESGIAEYIYVNPALILKADNNNPPTTVIEHANITTDIASDLAGKRYAKAKATATITVTEVTGAKVTEVSTNGYAVATAAPYTVYQGDEVTVVYTADEGYEFADGAATWTTNFTASAATVTVTIPEGERPTEKVQPISYLAPVYKEIGGIASPTNGIAHWVTNNVPDGYAIVESSESRVTWGTAGAESWYVVTNEVSLSQGVNCAGAVHLVLCDGAELTVEKGIAPTDGSSFTIYGQFFNTGVLTVTGPSSGAGIGGGYEGSGKNITINGGTVKATGGIGSAGIGGGYGGSGEYITINGGTVEAAGGGSSCAGIGGGSEGAGSNITINGGTVTARSGYDGAGIGGGPYGRGNLITINGGTVTATVEGGGAGIGGGNGSAGENITINGGTVTVAGEYGGAGIGGGCYGGNGNAIAINGGIVYAKGGSEAAGIGGGEYGSSSGVYLNGGMISVASMVEYEGNWVMRGDCIGRGYSGSSATDTRIFSKARVLFNLTGAYYYDTREKTPFAEPPETLEVPFTIMTPGTQTVDRVLVGGLGEGGAAGVRALPWVLTNAVTGATGEIAVNAEAHTPFASTLVRLAGDEEAGTLTLALDAPTLRFVQSPNATNNYTVVAETDAPGGIVNYAWGAVAQMTRDFDELMDDDVLEYSDFNSEGGVLRGSSGSEIVWIASNLPEGGTFHFTCSDDIELPSDLGTMERDTAGGDRWTVVPKLYNSYYILYLTSSGTIEIRDLTYECTDWESIAEGADLTAFPVEEGEIGSNYICRVSCVCAGKTYTFDAPFTFVGVRTLAQPPVVAGTTAQVYTNGVLSAETVPGSGLWNVWSNQTATVVYTAQERGLYFADGKETVTVALDTSKNPAVPAVAPPVPVKPSVKVSNTIAQRYPWNGLVDVQYRAKNWPVNAGGCTIRFKVRVGSDGDWIDAGTATPDGSGTVRGALTIDLKKLGLPTDRGTAKVKGAFEMAE